MQLLIEIRHQQMYNLQGTPIVYAGVNPQSLNAIPGAVSSNTWIDITDEVTNLDEFTLTWTQTINDSGASATTPGAFESKKTASDTISVYGTAYDYIKTWLIDDVAAPLNAIECRVTDTSCGKFTNFSIKNTDLTYLEYGPCEFDIILKQKDAAWKCFEQTLITDNWQGWFPSSVDGVPYYSTGKQHPRFSYCVEQRPNATLIIEWYLISIICGIFLTIFTIIFGILDIIIFVVNAIIAIVETIIYVLSLGSTAPPSIHTLDYLDTSGMVEYFVNLYMETAGCGREHPAPLIRDYLSNVCGRCGIKVDATTCPIFFAPTLTLTTASRGKITIDNPYYNACYLEATAKRGVRRIHNNNLFNGPNADNTTFWIPENGPIMAGDQFCDKIKGIFNHEWNIKGNTLYFWRKDWFLNSTPIYDFTENGVDRIKLLQGLQISWTSETFKAYATGIYQQDGADTCANEAIGQMNGIANFGQTDNNPNYEGVMDKTQPFGATKFRLDGASTDYIYDAMQQLSVSQLLNPQMVPQMRRVDDYLLKYCNYCLLMKDEISTLPKILCWDGVNFLNAKCVRDVVPVNNFLVPSDPVPVPNAGYAWMDTDPVTGNITFTPYTWKQKHDPETFVLSSSWTAVSAHDGAYQVTDYFGTTIAHAAARLVNYPMYFEPHYQGTLWDLFHWIDDPRRNPSMRMNWVATMELCCDDLKKLNLLGDGTGANLYEPVKLPFLYYPIGIITQIKASYSSSNPLGHIIELTGNA